MTVQHRLRTQVLIHIQPTGLASGLYKLLVASALLGYRRGVVLHALSGIRVEDTRWAEANQPLGELMDTVDSSTEGTLG